VNSTWQSFIDVAYIMLYYATYHYGDLRQKFCPGINSSQLAHAPWHPQYFSDVPLTLGAEPTDLLGDGRARIRRNIDVWAELLTRTSVRILLRISERLGGDTRPRSANHSPKRGRMTCVLLSSGAAEHTSSLEISFPFFSFPTLLDTLSNALTL